ncbi:hypothetical protein [Levilactobacillus brevis]
MTTMEDIQATPNFSTQAHILASDFHLSNKDAESLLLERIYHRLQSGKEFNDWVTTWSRKDCERTLGNEYRYNAEHVDDGYQMDDITNPSSEVATELSDEVLSQIFPDSRSREFVSEVLKHGKQQAMATFGLTKQQFNSRLNHKLRYIDRHSALINQVLATDERKSMESEKQLIELFLNDMDNPLLEDDDDLNSVIRTLFNIHPVLHDWLDDAKEQLGLKYEREVVNNFTNSGKDGRLFLQYLYQQLDEIDTQLKGSN